MAARRRRAACALLAGCLRAASGLLLGCWRAVGGLLVGRDGAVVGARSSCTEGVAPVWGVFRLLGVTDLTSAPTAPRFAASDGPFPRYATVSP